MCKREAAAVHTEQTGLALKQPLDIDGKSIRDLGRSGRHGNLL